MRDTRIIVDKNRKTKKKYKLLLGYLAAVLFAEQSFCGQPLLSPALSQAAVIVDKQGTVNVKTLKVKQEAGGTKNLKTNKGVLICLKKGKTVNVKKKVSVKGVSWYKVSFSFQKKTYRGYVKKTQILLSQPSSKAAEKEMGTVSATSLNVRTSADVSSSILEYQKKKIALPQGTEVTILSEDVSSGAVWYHVSFVYGEKKLKGYVSGKYITLSEDGGEKEEETEAEEAQNQGSNGEEGQKEEAVPEPEQEKTGAVETGKAAEKAARVLTEEEFEAALAEQNFPESYKPYLRELHKQQPTWTFHAYHTGLSWSEVIKKQSKVGRNLVPSSKNIAWKSLEEGAYDWISDTFVVFDGTTWVSASKKAVKYYMDPRNFLNKTGIYQFELLSYQSDFQSRQGVRSILKNTPMAGESSYTYTNPETGSTENMTYADTFMKAAEVSGVSPYHLASRVRQEVVTGTDSFSNSASGTYAGYEGYYNFYNIGASDSAGGGAVAKGLAWAKKTDDSYLLPWTSPYRAILGGALYIGKSYINKGQNTLYLEKFNVTPVSTYNHQYMTNVEAACAEAKKIYAAYSSMESVPVVFSIPVYEDMPETACAMPGDAKNPNNLLKSLTVKDYSLTPTFHPEDEPGMVYNLIVDSTVESIKINAASASVLAVVDGTGKQVLETGTNIFSVQVTAENGDIREYTINVIRKEE